MDDVTEAPRREPLAATRTGAAPWAMPPAREPLDGAEEGAPRSGAGATLASWNEAETSKLARARVALRLAGGATSLALVAGLGLWGHKLMLREVLGLPVVAAAEGPMRVAPAEPGGTVAADMGLSVNGVPAAGGAAAPSDVLLLAPDGPGLAPEDMVIQTSAEAAEPRLGASDPEAAPVDPLGTPVTAETAATASVLNPGPSPADVTDVVATAAPATPTITARPMSPEEVLAFADSIAAGADPLAALASSATTATPADPAAPVAEAVAPAAVPEATPEAIAPIPASVPGLATALRPLARPAAPAADAPAADATVTLAAATATASEATAASASAPEAAPEPVALTADIASGTALVQLGAFDSPDVAASEWERLVGAFPDFLDGRERVVQEAVSGGQTFYRLRATGFSDLPDARRLCAVFEAEGQDCVTYVVP